MPTVGLDRLVQQDFSGGMFRSVAPELIPDNGAYDITNGLLSEEGAIFKRGGTTYRSTSALAGPITMVWDGWLNTGGQTTVIARSGQFAKMAVDGTITSLGGSGLVTPTRPAVLGGVLYFPGGVTYDGATLGSIGTVGDYYAAVANRLFAGINDIVSFSDIWSGTGAPAFTATDFHRLPGGVKILGMQPLRDSLAVFATDGIWVISNLGFDLTDADGNVQHRLDQYARDIVLWGDAGIAGWSGGLIVPAVDAIWNVSLGVTSEAPQPFGRISDPISTLYRDYVRNGHTPGAATVIRGHYILPILSGAEVVDTLVCRLDRPGHPWTRLSGFGAKNMAVGIRVDATTRRPELLGGSTNGRVLNLSYFEPSSTNTLDADGTAFSWSVTTRDYMTGRMVSNTVVKLRTTYELSGAGATLEAFYVSSRVASTGTFWADFNWGAANWSAAETEDVALDSLGGAPVDNTGASPYSWSIRKKTRYARFRLRSESASSRLSLRALEVFVRSNGRI